MYLSSLAEKPPRQGRGSPTPDAIPGWAWFAILAAAPAFLFLAGVKIVELIGKRGRQ